MTDTFLFYDLETYSINPRQSRIAQFAAIRTDSELNIIEEPISFFIQPASDLLPSPIATLITGITPQQALRDGVTEAEAFATINGLMSQPKTCTLGYNSIRFDDEFIRYGLFRNFHDAYEREWKAGNSRWDLLDVMRLTHALRPDGINWPQREDGAPSFKLEDLALSNNVRTGDAHEALSDVYATIGMAKAMRQHQPKLWDYALQLRNKRFASNLLNTIEMLPVLHISGKYPAQRLCAAPVLPLTRHPTIDSRVIVFDLDADPDLLLQLEPDEIADRLYTPTADLPEGEQRVPLKEIHLNKSPAIIPWNYLRQDDFTRLQIDPAAILEKSAQLREIGAELAEKIRKVFAYERDYAQTDVDASLYGSFLSQTDKQLSTQVRITPTKNLASLQPPFKDTRLPELLFRYRARNWPDTLNLAEQQQWDDYRRHRLNDDCDLSEFTFEQYFTQITQLRSQHPNQTNTQALLDQLENWGQELQNSL